jgi:hypothetical protein
MWLPSLKPLGADMSAGQGPQFVNLKAVNHVNGAENTYLYVCNDASAAPAQQQRKRTMLKTAADVFAPRQAGLGSFASHCATDRDQSSPFTRWIL